MALSKEQVNEALEQKLSNLKTLSRESGTIPSLVDELNEILYSALTRYAPEVNAVSIRLAADVTEDTVRTLPEGGKRHLWRDYLNLALQKPDLGGVQKYEFVAHPPFRFITGTHGSYEREAIANSVQNMQFLHSDIRNRAVAYFTLDLAESFTFSIPPVSFLPSEVESIRLVQAEDSQFSRSMSTDQRELRPSYSALYHYLRFRRFRKRSFGASSIPEGEWKSGIASLCDNLLLPSDNLLKTLKSDDRLALSGFAAVDTPEGFVVYEFSGVDFPTPFCDYSNMDRLTLSVAYAVDLHRRTPQSNINVYTGDAAIARLHEVKEERRF